MSQFFNVDKIPVSVIIPCYNNESFLRECVLSINSDHTPCEIIIVDDCSTDRSLEVAKQLALEADNIKVISMHSNSGAAAARRTGFLNASFDLVAWVDSDDILESGAILDAYLKLTPDCDLCIWELWRLNIDGNSYKDTCNPDYLPVDGNVAVLLSLGKWKIHAAGVARKSLFLQAYENLDVESYNNDEIITRLILSSSRKIVGSSKRYYYRINPNSTTSVVTDRHLSHLRSEIWLLRFSLSLTNAPIDLIIKNSLKSAFKLYLHRRKFKNSFFIYEMRNFVFSALNIKEYMRFVLVNPIYLLMFLFLFVYVKLNDH